MAKNEPPKMNLWENEKEFRELLKLQSDPEVQQYILKLNEEYVHWEKMRHYRHPKGATSENIWNLLKISRISRYRRITMNNVVFKYVLTDHIWKCLHELDQRTSGTIETGDEQVAREADVTRYLANSIMEEAIASSQLEGAVTSRRVAKEMLRSGEKPKDKSQHMIVNAYETLMFLKDRTGGELTPELICEIQSKMTINTLEEKYLGKFRDNNEVRVVDSGTGETVHVPPKQEEVPKFVESLCKFINLEGETFLHPIIKAIILHFMIGYIHPFEDGNGRTGRALFYWYVLKKGYWLLEYAPISRIIKNAHGRYSKAYTHTENDENDLTYFLVFNLRQIKIALKEFTKYLKMKKRESEKVKEIMQRDNRVNMRQSDIVLRLMKNPLRKFSIDEIKRTYSVAYQTARTDLDLLAKLGYCEVIVERRRFLYSYKDRFHGGTD